MTLTFKTTSKSKTCNVTPDSACYMSWWVNNPSGWQNYTALTISNNLGQEISPVRVAFRA